MWITIARLLWAFDIEPGLSEETGKAQFIDAEASTDGLIMRSLPFSLIRAARSMGAWHHHERMRYLWILPLTPGIIVIETATYPSKHYLIKTKELALPRIDGA